MRPRPGRALSCAVFTAVGLAAGCECVGLPPDALYLCDEQGRCPPGLACGADLVCRPPAVLDDGGGAPADAGPPGDGGNPDGGVDAGDLDGGVDGGRPSSDWPLVCSAAGWCWMHPRPTGAFLGRVWGSGPDDVWTVGGQGVVLHWNGSSLQVLTSGGPDLEAVWGSSPTDVWLGGAGGIRHWDGSAFSGYSVSVPLAVNDIAGWDKDHAFAVGAAASVHRWDGQSWSLVGTGGFPAPYRSLSLDGPKSGITVGKDGRFALFTSGSLSSSQDPAATSFSAVAYRGHDVWFTTDTGTLAYGRVDAGTNIVRPSGPGLSDLWVSDAGTVYAAGASGQLLRWRGADEPGLVGIPAHRHLSGLWGAGEDDLFVAGSGGYFARWTRGRVVQLNAEVTGVGFRGISAASDDQLWAVTDVGDLVELRPEGFRLHRGPTVRAAKSVWARRGEVVMVATDGFIGSYGNGSWAIAPSSPNDGEWLGVWGDSATGDLWVVGRGSRYRRRVDGGWGPVQQAADAGEDLFSVHGDGQGEVWAVASRGAVFRWVSGGWVRTLSNAGTFRDVWVVGPSDVWVAGLNGRLGRFNGTGWDHGYVAGQPTLTAICARADGGVVVAGDNGVTYAVESDLNGVALESGTTSGLTDLACPPRHTWVVGSGGEVLRR